MSNYPQRKRLPEVTSVTGRQLSNQLRMAGREDSKVPTGEKVAADGKVGEQMDHRGGKVRLYI